MNSEHVDTTLIPAQCRPYREMLLDSHYGESDAAAEKALQSHLAGCADCRGTRADWQRIAVLLSAPDVAAALAAPRARPFLWLAAGLGGSTALVSLMPVLVSQGHARLGTAVVLGTALMWTLAYQALFAGLLAEHRRQQLPVDMRTVLLGLLACEGALVLAAGTVLSAPLLDWRLTAAVRLSVPGLITALSGSIVVAIGAFLGIRGHARPVANAVGIALLHALLMVPSQMLIDPFSRSLGGWLGSVAFLVACALLGASLGSVGAVLERTRAAGGDWHAEPA